MVRARWCEGADLRRCECATVSASIYTAHIAQIYGLEDSGGVRALVMELVEGVYPGESHRSMSAAPERGFDHCAPGSRPREPVARYRRGAGGHRSISRRARTARRRSIATYWQIVAKICRGLCRGSGGARICRGAGVRALPRGAGGSRARALPDSSLANRRGSPVRWCYRPMAAGWRSRRLGWMVARFCGCVRSTRSTHGPSRH